MPTVLTNSSSQGYWLLKKAWAQTKDDMNQTGIDRQEVLSWLVQALMAARLGREDLRHRRRTPEKTQAMPIIGASHSA